MVALKVTKQQEGHHYKCSLNYEIISLRKDLKFVSIT